MENPMHVWSHISLILACLTYKPQRFPSSSTSLHHWALRRRNDEAETFSFQELFNRCSHSLHLKDTVSNERQHRTSHTWHYPTRLIKKSSRWALSKTRTYWELWLSWKNLSRKARAWRKGRDVKMWKKRKQINSFPSYTPAGRNKTAAVWFVKRVSGKIHRETTEVRATEVCKAKRQRDKLHWRVSSSLSTSALLKLEANYQIYPLFF